MNKPVDLTVSNVLWRTLEAEAAVKAFGSGPAPAKLAELAARGMLSHLASEAEITFVLAALATFGAPSSIDEINARLQALRDASAEKPAVQAAAPGAAGAQ